MKALIKIFCEFERNKPRSLVYVKSVDVNNEKEVKSFCDKRIKEFLAIYEQSLLMQAEVLIEPILLDNTIDLLPE